MSVKSALHALIDEVVGHEPGAEIKRLELHNEVDAEDGKPTGGEENPDA